MVFGCKNTLQPKATNQQVTQYGKLKRNKRKDKLNFIYDANYTCYENGFGSETKKSARCNHDVETLF